MSDGPHVGENHPFPIIPLKLLPQAKYKPSSVKTPALSSAQNTCLICLPLMISKAFCSCSKQKVSYSDKKTSGSKSSSIKSSWSNIPGTSSSSFDADSCESDDCPFDEDSSELLVGFVSAEVLISGALAELEEKEEDDEMSAAG